MTSKVRRLRWAAAAVFVAAAAWWLFGFTTHREGPFTTRFHRRWGRVTRIDMSASGAPGARERLLFPWTEAYEQGDPATSCAAIFPEAWEDSNNDGMWDMWRYRVGPDARGECSTEYRVDLTRDGVPDWRFISPHGQHEEARKRIVARRGF